MFVTLIFKQQTMKLEKEIKWRYATKAMNGEKVAQDKVDAIVDAARYAPTSSGLQPFKILVITNPELKAKITPIAYNQPQIEQASHVLVFAAWDNYSEERVNKVFAYGNKERGLPDTATDAYRTQLLGMFANLTADQQFAHAARQAYISLGFALLEAAAQEVDATPMEGFVNAQLDELLGLEAKGLKSVLVVTLGYRDADKDWLVNLKKVRKPDAELVEVLN